MDELVSVICTVKNGENTISETIESVLNQSYEKWEFIIIDDGSTDETKNILKKYAFKDERIKNVFSGGIGRSKALNTAISLSKGKYIANIDADDLMHPLRIEFQVGVLKKNQNLFLLATKSIIIYDEDNPEWNTNTILDTNLDYLSDSIYLNNTISHPSVIMNKGKLEDLGGYNLNRQSLVDYDLWLRAYSNNLSIATLNNILTAKRIHKNQSFENKKRLNYTYSNLKLQLQFLTKTKKYHYYPIPFIKFILAQLPFSIRRKINATINNE